ncbi:hypothetical protein GGTG_13093 [Gaeumannomyces tritici R3-111a-1]|uniref:Uncharacterized protein n=1 Tax=Gaeumannomyces tritici (strain R3-111a-1) TaxID=644352 RepID=J3PHW2_GAET3|nr:hypothetical protein GGTG_13093 [Gaeumannomyces tritici R3-111a-1]EJT69474.1 hypothetical protein GGTG_13093 [Gaeumannomyces tritici R3-111a-1]
MIPLASLLGLVPYIWADLLHGSLAAQEPLGRVEFGAVNEIPGGVGLSALDNLLDARLPGR